jgi:acetate kinase
VDVGRRVSKVLCINAGSSSLKFAVIEDAVKVLARGAVERIGNAEGHSWIERDARTRQEDDAPCPSPAAALDHALALLEKRDLDRVDVVAHRVVHGGPDHVAPVRVDDALLSSLRKVVALAPLHMPPALAGIDAMKLRHPALPQVVCFDTAFHAAMPEVARRLPLPSRFAEVRRYGFHGLSYEYVMSVLGEAVAPRIVIAHLGSGASLVAVRDGKAIDTTMGFTPTGGVVMGTRTGDIDPGVLVYLAREHGLSTDALEQLVERESGLLAIGGTSDMTELLGREDHQAKLAVQMFGYAVRKSIGALTAALGGIDLLIFTGGIGEHAAAIRAEACRDLDAFGIILDPAKNDHPHDVVSADGSRCLIRVIATDEDMMLARHALRVMRST